MQNIKNKKYEKQKTKRTKENQNNIRINQKTKFFKVSDLPLDMGLDFLFFFSNVFMALLQKQKNIGKTQKNKENQRKPKKR